MYSYSTFHLRAHPTIQPEVTKEMGYHLKQNAMLLYHDRVYSGNAGKSFREGPGTPDSDGGDRVEGGLPGWGVLSCSSPTRSTPSTSAVVSLESNKLEETPSKHDAISAAVDGAALCTPLPDSCLSLSASVSGSLTRTLGGVFGRGGVDEPMSVSLSLLSNPSDIGVRGSILSLYDTLSASPCRVRDLACAPPG